MIVRLVELQFDEQHFDEAQKKVEAVAPKVRRMPGCLFLEIIIDIHKKGHVTTYSYWEDESDLNNYRTTKTFLDFWKSIKPLFSAPARAWSSESLYRNL